MSDTVNATAYKKVYTTDADRFRLEIDYFVFYGEDGREYKVDPDDVEYKYDVTNSEFNMVKAIVIKGDFKWGRYDTAVITLPASQDGGMR